MITLKPRIISYILIFLVIFFTSCGYKLRDGPLELNNLKPIIYELGGENYSFKELIQILLNEIRKKGFLIPVPFGMAKFQSYFLQMMPTPLLTPDQVEMLKHNNVVSGEYKTLKNLKIKSTTIQSILPKYIYRFRAGGQFS